MKDFEEKPVPRPVKLAFGLGSLAFLAGGLAAGIFLRAVSLGVLLFAIGGILFAIRGYFNTEDKAVAGALIFVALTAIGSQAILYFLGP